MFKALVELRRACQHLGVDPSLKIGLMHWRDADAILRSMAEGFGMIRHVPDPRGGYFRLCGVEFSYPALAPSPVWPRNWRVA